MTAKPFCLKGIHWKILRYLPTYPTLPCKYRITPFHQTGGPIKRSANLLLLKTLPFPRLSDVRIKLVWILIVFILPGLLCKIGCWRTFRRRLGCRIDLRILDIWSICGNAKTSLSMLIISMTKTVENVFDIQAKLKCSCIFLLGLLWWLQLVWVICPPRRTNQSRGLVVRALDS